MAFDETNGAVRCPHEPLPTCCVGLDDKRGYRTGWRCTGCPGAAPIVARATLDEAQSERDAWIRLWNRMEAAISHHRAAKLAGVDTSDEADEALWKARDKILRDAVLASNREAGS